MRVGNAEMGGADLSREDSSWDQAVEGTSSDGLRGLPGGLLDELGDTQQEGEIMRGLGSRRMTDFGSQLSLLLRTTWVAFKQTTTDHEIRISGYEPTW